jgi:hypothetical protein
MADVVVLFGYKELPSNFRSPCEYMPYVDFEFRFIVDVVDVNLEVASFKTIASEYPLLPLRFSVALSR